MQYYFLTISLLLLSLRVCHATMCTPQEIYWASVLPEIPMPSAITDRLPDGSEIGKTIDHDPGHVTIIRWQIPRTSTGTNFTPDQDVYNNENLASMVVAGHLYFLEKDLYPSAKLKVAFTKTSSKANKFISRQVANSIPFSSLTLPQILKQFSIEPESESARIMKKTIEECEAPTITSRERKYCATSLESMVEFSMSTLGTNRVKAVSTDVLKGDKVPQQYTVVSVRMIGNDVVACHPVGFVYAVFYCHDITPTKAYTVEMVGEDGTMVQAAAICHTDTKQMDPNHVAFKVLKVKPGTTPICHFIPQDDVIWSRKTLNLE